MFCTCKAYTRKYPFSLKNQQIYLFSTRKTWNQYWLIDPLDGTREFIKHNGEFTVNVALIEQHRPVLGVVHVPVTGITYFATMGNGAFKQLPDGAEDMLKVKKKRLQKTLPSAGKPFTWE